MKWIAVLLLATVTVHAQGRWEFLSDKLQLHYTFSGDARNMVPFALFGDARVTKAIPASDRFFRPDSAYYFNATNSSAIVADARAVPTGTNDRTISVWFRADRVTTPGRVQRLVSYGGNGPGAKFSLFLTTAGSLGVDLGGGSMYAAMQPVFDGRWHSVAVVMAANSVGGFLDGRSFDWATFPILGTTIHTISNSLFSVGNYGGDYFDGFIDDVRVYGRALSSREVFDLHRVESERRPALDSVKAIGVSVLCEVGKRYQLERSRNLRDWSDYGLPFTATKEILADSFPVDDYGWTFRVRELP